MRAGWAWCSTNRGRDSVTPDARKRERILIRGARVYDHEADLDFPPVADVVIEDGAITLVGRADPEARHDRVIDARGKLLLPGFFNAHYHAHDTLLKGCFETLPLDFWALYAMPHAYGRRSREELRLRTLVGAVECIRTGITTVQDMHSLTPFDEGDMDTILETYESVGLRCVFAPQFTNLGRMKARAFYEEVIPEAERWRLSSSTRQFPEGTDIVGALEAAIRSRRGRYPLVDFALGPASPESCTRELLERVADLSRRENLPVYSHIYENKGMTHIARVAHKETKGSLVHLLHECGLLGPRLTLAHSVWLRRDEIDLLGETRSNVALNPVGNLKTRSGVAPAKALLEAGVNVSLGCDNCSCSDVQNMFQSMKMYSSLAGLCDPEEGPPYARDALHAATIAGAQTANRPDLGRIRPGARGDIVILDLGDISYVPLNSVGRQVVYTESGRGVETVIIDGRVVMEQRRLLTVDEAALREEVERAMPPLLRDLAAVRERLRPIEGGLLEAQTRTWNTDIGVERTLPPIR